MHNRGGFPVRNLLYAVFLVLIIYMVYIYQGSQNRLRDSEMTGSRYKKEVEERVNEIQEIVRAKDRLQESCQNDKAELNNRIKSINQQYSMVQSQLKETSADLTKMKQDMETLRLDQSRADEVHKLEYQKMKQDKENEITKLRDEVADVKRRKVELETSVLQLREQLQNEENAQKKLMEENEQLRRLQNRPPQQPQDLQQQQQQQQQQPAGLKAQSQNNFLPGQQLGQDNVNDAGSNLGAHNFVQNMHINDNNKFDQGQGRFGNFDVQGQGHQDTFNKPVMDMDRLGREMEDVKPHIDELQAQRQVAPPHSLDVDDAFKAEDDKAKENEDGLDDEGNDRPEINPNDEQKGQILEPMLDERDKHMGGGEAGVEGMNARLVEEARERGDHDDDADDGFLQHKNPLALGQIEMPDSGNAGEAHRGVNNNADLGQQIPPVLKDHNEQNGADNVGAYRVVRAINPVAPGGA